MSELTADDYKKVLLHGSADLKSPRSGDLESIRIIFTDNMIGRSYRTWDREALDSMAELLPGCPFTVDHDWDDIKSAVGVIYDAKVLDLKTIPNKFIGKLTPELNRKILSDDGWMPLVGKIAVYKDSCIIEQLALGSAGKVSIGGFNVTSIWCPLCKCDFADDDCPHNAPSPWYEADENTAPYIIRKTNNDMGETSFVLIPNAPNAGMITNDIASFFAEVYP